MQPPPMSERLVALIEQVPGAKAAYLTNSHSKMWMEALDTQWQAVVDAVTEIADPDVGVAEAVADAYMRIMLDLYVTSAIEGEVLRSAAIRALKDLR